MKKTILLIGLLAGFSVLVFGQDVGVVTVDDITDDPETYYGRFVTVEEEIVDTVGAAGFVLEENELIPESLLVLHRSDTIEGLNMGQLAEDDIRLVVEGVVEQFSIEELDLDFEIDLSFDDFLDYEGQPVIIAETVIIVEELNNQDYGLHSLDTVLDDPEVYYGEVITVQQNIVEALYPNAFLLQDDDNFISEELLVLFNDDDYDYDIEIVANNGDLMRVRGRLVPLNVEDVGEVFDFDFDTQLFEDYDEAPALLAESVAILTGRATGEGDDLTLDTVLSNAPLYYGEDLTLRGEVETVFNNGTLIVEDSDLVNSEQLMLLTETDTAFDFVELFQDEDVVEFTGTFYEFGREDFEEGLEIDFSDPFYENWEGEGVMVVTEIELVQEDE